VVIKICYNCRLSVYIVITITEGWENESFANNSGKLQPIQTKFDTHSEVKKRQRSGNIGRNRPSVGKIGGSDEAVFLPGVNLSTTDFHKIWPCFVEDFRKFSAYGSFSPIAQNRKGANKYLTLTSLQHYRETLFTHIVVQGPESFPSLVRRKNATRPRENAHIAKTEPEVDSYGVISRTSGLFSAIVRDI